MKTTHSTFVYAIMEVILLIFLTLLVPLIVVLDIQLLEQNISESSLTELTQETVLFISALLFGIYAWRNPHSRGFAALAAGLFLCMFIRELDAFFDNLVSHGFWLWPALLTACASVAYALCHRETVTRPLTQCRGSKAYYYLLFGLLIVLVLSRTLGSGTLVWKAIMGDAYSGTVKTVLQEGLELFGDLLIGAGALLFSFRKEEAVAGSTPLFLTSAMSAETQHLPLAPYYRSSFEPTRSKDTSAKQR